MAGSIVISLESGDGARRANKSTAEQGGSEMSMIFSFIYFFFLQVIFILSV